MAVMQGNLPCLNITHKQAVQRIIRWMRFSRRCSVVIAELKTYNTEIPDVIGWYGASSTLIECKVSRADFLSDKNKHFRRYEEAGMGNLRYFATPKDLLSPDELPEGWGLLEIEEHCIREKKKPESKPTDKQCEVINLVFLQMEKDWPVYGLTYRK